METIMMLHEGVCPNCNGDVEITHLGGTADELEYWTPPADVTPVVWERNSYALLGITYRCSECGAEHYIEKTLSGDWA